MNFLKLLRVNLVFVLPYGLILMGLGVYQILYRQGIILLEINRFYNDSADVFFQYVTHLGDGLFCIAVGLAYWFRSWIKSVAVLVSYAVSGILAQLIKHFGFPKEPRPAEYFSKMMDSLHTVPGIELSHWNSFPSGHTTSAFALFALLSLWGKPPWWKLLCLCAATAVGFSRMYLLQHFLVDVYAGSLLGTLTAWAVFLRLEPILERKKVR